MKSMTMKIGFSVDAADHSVGIGESVAAWQIDGTCWCRIISSVAVEEFEWFDNESGDPVARPANAVFVEQALQGFVKAYYQSGQRDDACESQA